MNRTPSRVVQKLFLPLILTTAMCSGQSDKSSGKTDLSRLSSDQLRNCYADIKRCGATSSWDISDELANRLPALTTEELVSCFDDFEICGLVESDHLWPISDEIARRGDPHELLVRYWKEPRPFIRDGIEDVAYHFDTPEVTAFMRRILSERMTRKDDHYSAVNYLAKKCDVPALKRLSSGRYRYLGSLQYETSVELFGKCGFRRAIPYLVDTAVYDVSLNIVIAADRSLHALYPDGPKDFDKLKDMQSYFCGRAKQEGFKVHCKAP